MQKKRIDISLLEFFRTGYFGPITLGMKRRDDFLVLLGEPDDFGPKAPYMWADIWQYGDIEFHFEKKSRELFLIFCDYIPLPGKESAVVNLDPWIFAGPKPPARSAIEQGLQDAGISFRYIHVPEADRYPDGHTCASMATYAEDGVFDEEERAQGHLTAQQTGTLLLGSGVKIGLGDLIVHCGERPPRVVVKDMAMIISLIQS